MSRTTLRVSFATNRRPLGSPITDFSKRLSAHEGTDLRYGTVEVDVSGKPVADKSSLAVAGEKLFAEKPRAELVLGSNEVCDDLRADMRTSDALGVIHGYFNSFFGSIEGAAQVLKNADRLGFPLFAFCWPSDDALAGYLPDRADSRASGKALARAVVKFVDYVRNLSKREFCNHEVNLLCHSMGNYVLRAGLQAIRTENPELLERQIFSDVILVAADEDADSLERDDKLRLITRLASRVTVYHTERDGALWTSDKIKFNPDRLGRRGPASISATPDNVFAVDVSDVIEPDRASRYHNYHRTVPVVGRDIAALLDGGELTLRQPMSLHPRRMRLLPG
jgi:esterase/lipase superfamily enzyme